ncbi:LytTR family DNA-binding domain-containing protein [Olivibacter sp. CPCC 100613]|uniref:LytTR family DNA-binding domain-containing protein n=1 Tax=Olivibacter sp. CPCC 100613 TaxID=3079931 RepID=UPI002FFB8510
MGGHENEMVNKPRHFVSISMRVQGAMYAAFFMALSGTRLNKGFLDIFLHLKFYVDWLVIAVIAYTLIDFVIAKTDSFDGMLNWKVNPEKRLSYQFWFLCFFPYLICELCDLLYLQLMDRSLFRLPYKVYEIPTSLSFLLVLNAAYPLAKYVIGGQRNEEKEDIEIQSASLMPGKVLPPSIEPLKSLTSADEKIGNSLIVFGGKDGKTKMLKPKDVAAIIQQHGINNIYTFSLETFTCLGTLKAMYSPLDKQDFFKANKNTVIHRNAIGELESREDGGLNVFIKPYYDQAVSISHHERKAFTDWYTRPISPLGKLIMLPL